MAQQKIPENPAYKYTSYTNLKGIDLSNDITQIASYHAADLLNVYPDPANGNPRKRMGWRSIYAFPDGTQFLGSRHISEWNLDFIVTNKGVYWHKSDETTWTSSNVKRIIANSDSIEAGVGFIGFDSNKNYSIMAYKKFYKLAFNGSTMSFVNDQPHAPTTIISRNPDGTGGYPYESVNAFSRWRIISFLGSAGTNNYYFYPSADRSNHLVVTVEAVEVRNATTGEWEEVEGTIHYTGQTITAYSKEDKSETKSYQTIDYVSITGRDPVVGGQDNVRAWICEFPTDKDGSIYNGFYEPIADGIKSNAICARYGMTSMDREFYVAGNGKIYYTAPDMYDYVPDDNFFQLEVDSPVMGFHRRGNNLIAITKDSAEYTVYQINGSTFTITHSVLNEQGVRETTTEDITYFIARTAMAGTGAISGRSFATLVDDTLFLSRHGVYGITSNNLTTETIVANRSELINPRLLEEANLEDAVATVWNGMYLLALNTHVYLLDSKCTHKNVDISYGYECYYWENVNATDWLSYNGNLFFGDSEGRWCRFNTDITNVTAYEDNGIVQSNGSLAGGDAIHAYYKTRLDADGAPQYLKTLNKRGTAMELMQISNSEIKLSVSKDGNTPILINQANLDDRFTWTLIDFENFSFNTISNIRTFYPRKKIKKYKYLQFIFESDEIDKNFGICGLTKTYYIGNFAKR